MISIVIKTDGKEIYSDYREDEPTLIETALMVHTLEQFKLDLLDKEFKPKFEISGEGEDEDDV